MSSTSRSRTSITAAPRPRARRPMESASASIAPSWMSSIGWRSVKRSITPSTSCRPTLMLGSPNTTTTAPIRAAGASARPRCRPFLTRYHWQRRNSWPHDHGRQPYTGSHSQHRLSDQVSANTDNALVARLSRERLSDGRLQGLQHRRQAVLGGRRAIDLAQISSFTITARIGHRQRVLLLLRVNPDKRFGILLHGPPSAHEARLGPPEQPLVLLLHVRADRRPRPTDITSERIPAVQRRRRERVNVP